MIVEAVAVKIGNEDRQQEKKKDTIAWKSDRAGFDKLRKEAG